MNIFTNVVRAASRPNVIKPLLTNVRFLSTNLLPDITLPEVKEKLKDPSVVLIDCRSEEEYQEEGYVPGFINMPVKLFGNLILLPEDKFKKETGMEKPKENDEIVIMCLLGLRARTCQLALKGVGYENVRMYKGSFKEWRDNNEKIVFPAVKK